MNSAINKIINSYSNVFMEAIANKYSLPLEELQDMWKDTIKMKPKKIKKATTSPKKKRVSAYISFCEEKRAELKETNPGMSFAAISKELGRLWREADDETKAWYKKRAQEGADVSGNEAVPKKVKKTKPKKTNTATDELTGKSVAELKAICKDNDIKPIPKSRAAIINAIVNSGILRNDNHESDGSDSEHGSETDNGSETEYSDNDD